MLPKRFSLGCIIFVSVFWSTYAQLPGGGCGKNERNVKCVNICNNCAQKEPCPLSECYEGCECIPGFLRNSSGVCVPKSQCNAVYVNPLDGSEVALSGGCPNAEFCVVSCQLRNFKDGICLGPRKELCNCFSRVPPEPIPPPSPGALVDNPPLITDSRTACPNRAKCNALCKKKGPRFTGGICVGKDRRICRCIPCRPGTKGCPIINPRPPVVPPPAKRPYSKKRNPADLLSGGCPIAQACLQSCRLHGYRSGKCQGREKDLCRCLNCEPGVKGCPGLPEEFYPDFLEYY